MRFSTLFVAIFLFVVCVSSSPVTTANNETMHPEHSRSALNKRWRTFGPGYLPMQKRPPPLCNVFEGVRMHGINEGLATLKRFDREGKYCWSPPRHCQQLACSYAASIQLCNDNFEDIAINCAWMAGYVEDIIKACNKGCGRDTCVRGQLFDGGGFNVVVRYDNACNPKT